MNTRGKFLKIFLNSKMGGIEMTFNVNDKKMKLKQQGMEFEFVKK